MTNKSHASALRRAEAALTSLSARALSSIPPLLQYADTNGVTETAARQAIQVYGLIYIDTSSPDSLEKRARARGDFEKLLDGERTPAAGRLLIRNLERDLDRILSPRPLPRDVLPHRGR